MKALRCDFCDGALIMDRSREFATCEFCGTKYTKETVRDKIQEIKGTVKVEGAVETTTGEAEKERLLKNAETYKNLNEFDKALEVYQQVTQQFPDEYRGWWGIYTTPIERYFSIGIFNEENKNSLKNTINLTDNKNIINEYFESIINRYGNKLKLINATDKIILFLSKTSTEPLTPDSFTNWLLFHQKENEKYFPDTFKSFISKLSSLFIDGIINGSVYSPKSDITPLYSNSNLYINATKIPLNISSEFIAKINHARNSYSAIDYDFKISRGFNHFYVSEINGFFGRWIYALDESNNPIAILSSCEITTNMVRKFQGLCTYCGGRFKGIIKPVCKSCGKPKDY